MMNLDNRVTSYRVLFVALGSKTEKISLSFHSLKVLTVNAKYARETWVIFSEDCFKWKFTKLIRAKPTAGISIFEYKLSWQ